MKVEEIHEFMRTRAARHKQLMGGIAVIKTIPKNPVSFVGLSGSGCFSNYHQSGKILRKTLRDQAKVEVGDSDRRDSLL